MKQRVGIARALSIEPKIMLMDEPFSALDALTRGTLQDEVRRICLTTGQTVFMITHDVDEAIYLADRIVLMTNGPGAKLAEIVDNPLPKDRVRAEIHRHPLYYAVRNHIIDFLVTRSKNFAAELAGRALRPAPRAGGAAGRDRNASLSIVIAALSIVIPRPRVRPSAGPRTGSSGGPSKHRSRRLLRDRAS